MTCERHGGGGGSIVCRECDLETIERETMTKPTPPTADAGELLQGETMKVTDEMVDRFLRWPLPESVCSDLCVTIPNYCTEHGYPVGARSGTNLLTFPEARQMLEYVLAQPPKP